MKFLKIKHIGCNLDRKKEDYSFKNDLIIIVKHGTKKKIDGKRSVFLCIVVASVNESSYTNTFPYMEHEKNIDSSLLYY